MRAFASVSVCGLAVTLAMPAHAQTVEITPFGGYRVGSTFSDIGAGPARGDAGGPSVGVLVNVEFGSSTDGLKFEGLYSRHERHLETRPSLLEPPIRVPVEVDYLQAGGIQEFGQGRVRPFLSGLLGVTRFASNGDNAVRFSIGSGGGAKFFATRHFGLRLDGRLYLTIVEGSFAAACGAGCLVLFGTSPIWEVDFTAGAIVAF